MPKKEYFEKVKKKDNYLKKIIAGGIYIKKGSFRQ
jgi:hypothetical protein